MKFSEEGYATDTKPYEHKEGCSLQQQTQKDNQNGKYRHFFFQNSHQNLLFPKMHRIPINGWLKTTQSYDRPQKVINSIVSKKKPRIRI